MIILILSSCRDAPPMVFGNSQEQSAYEQLLEDYDRPRFKWGYIDTMGTLALKNEYDDCRDFFEGRAAVLKDGLWGYIDREGQQVVEPRYRTVQAYSDGLALVQTFTGSYLFLDRAGTVAIDTLPFREVYPYGSGLARVHDGSYYGYINKEGTLAIPCQYQTATNFSDGYAGVSSYGKSNSIDTTGRPIFQKIQPEKVYLPTDGMVRYQLDGKYRFADLRGRDLIDKAFVRATDFQGAYAIVFDGITTYTLSTNGRLAKLPYRSVEMGGEGKWIYRSGSKCGYLNNIGEQLTLPNYTLCTQYRDGMAAVRNSSDQWGYLSGDGLPAIAPEYPLAWDFREGRARMIDQQGYGFIDKTGAFIIEPYFIEVRDFYEGLARVQIFRQ